MSKLRNLMVLCAAFGVAIAANAAEEKVAAAVEQKATVEATEVVKADAKVAEKVVKHKKHSKKKHKAADAKVDATDAKDAKEVKTETTTITTKSEVAK